MTRRRSNARRREGYGAEIVLYDRERDDREAIGRRLAQERGLALIPPYDHPQVVAGQGTAALELFDEVGPLDVLLVPCGGGGLLAGSALSAETRSPGLPCDRRRALGWRRCDAIVSDEATAARAQPSDRCRRRENRVDERHDVQADAGHVGGMTTVDDGPLLDAMFYLWERLKLLVEPTGALGAAAAFENKVSIAGSRVGIVLTGGNVDLSQVSEWRKLGGNSP